LKNREEFEGALNKNLQRQGRISRRRGGKIVLAGQNIYPCHVLIRDIGTIVQYPKILLL